MKKIQAILFDCDGVLVDSESQLRKMMHDALVGADGYNLTFDEFLREVRGLDNPQVARVLERHNVTIPEGYFEECQEFFLAQYSNFADKVPNAKEMLESLDDYPKVVCSNNWTTVYKAALEKHDFVKYFKALLGQDVVEKGKPDPCVYLEGAKRAGVPIENCLAIEDTPGIGLKAATSSNAGAIVGFTGSGSSEEDLRKHGAEYIIHDLLELPELIKKLNS